MDSNRRIVLLTGVSCSGKTTIQNMLLELGWSRPYNFTTREPRTGNAYTIDKQGDYISDELKEYIFIDKDTFVTKLKNGDFLENTMFGGNFYGVSSTLPKGDLCIILDPVGRSMVSEYFTRKGINYETYFIDIDEEEQANRLRLRGDKEEEVIKRSKDFNWMLPTPKCKILDGTRPTEELVFNILGGNLG